MTAKLKINIPEGLLEVEGSESLVLKVYDDFKSRLEGMRESVPVPIPTPSNQTRGPEKTKEKAPRQKRAIKAGTSVSKNEGSLLKDLNLRPSGKKSLKDFVSEFKKPTSEEKILLYIYYLKNELAVSGLGLDHIYTCMKEMGTKIPTHLRQTVINVKTRKGWVDTENMDDLNYTVQGMNHVEHDLEKA